MGGARWDGGMDRRGPTLRQWGMLVPALLLGGCIFFEDEGRPDRARLDLEGGGSSSMELIVSTDFLVVQGSVSFQEADTTVVSLPFSETYPLSGPARIYVRAANLQDQRESFGMKVWIDDESWYNESRPLDPGEAFEFFYRYNEPRIQ